MKDPEDEICFETKKHVFYKKYDIFGKNFDIWINMPKLGTVNNLLKQILLSMLQKIIQNEQKMS